MARRRAAQVVRPGLRDELLARFRELAERHPHIPRALIAPSQPGPFMRTAAALVAGEPVTVQHFQLPDWAREVAPDGLAVTVLADGTMVAAEVSSS